MFFVFSVELNYHLGLFVICFQSEELPFLFLLKHVFWWQIPSIFCLSGNISISFFFERQFCWIHDSGLKVFDLSILNVLAFFLLGSTVSLKIQLLILLRFPWKWWVNFLLLSEYSSCLLVSVLLSVSLWASLCLPWFLLVSQRGN